MSRPDGQPSVPFTSYRQALFLVRDLINTADGTCVSESLTYSRSIMSTCCDVLSGTSPGSLIPPAEWVEWYSTGLIFMPTRITMSVGYSSCAKSVYFQYPREFVDRKNTSHREEDQDSIHDNANPWLRQHLERRDQIEYLR